MAQAPPGPDDRYFYFPDVPTQDFLFRSVAQGSCRHTEPTRENKVSLLTQLCERGVFLIDLKPDPADGSALSPYVPALLARIAELKPDRIILIKTDVYGAAYAALTAAGPPASEGGIGEIYVLRWGSGWHGRQGHRLALGSHVSV